MRAFSQTRAPRTERLSGRRGAAALAFVVGTALLSGCAGRHPVEVGSIPDDYRTRHPIVVDEDETVLEIPVTSSETRLSVASRGRIEDFGGQFRTSRSAAVRVLLPVGSANERAAELSSRDVVAALGDAGVTRDRILMQPYATGGHGGAMPIRLSYSALVAKTAPCGRWPEDLGDTEQNRNYFNFGCASQQNLAAQIADPRDLLGPRGRSSIDAARRTDMLESYRKGEATASDKPVGESNYEW